MKTVLIVDDNQIILDLLENKINQILDVTILKAQTYKEAVKHIIEQDIIHVAILDLDLPDSKNGQIVDFAISKNIPSVILTDLLNHNLQTILLQKDILDFVIKSDLNSMDYTVNIINRTLNNYDRSILVVDDSKFQLSVVSQMLEKMKINVVTAMDGQEALDIIRSRDIDKQFSIVLTDFKMPKMDGLELTLNIRNSYKKDELSIIVMSGNEEHEIATQFIKIGANDFIIKPFTETEFTTRVNSNLDLISLFEKTKELANKDYLTSAYNRRFFFESGKSIINKTKRKNVNVAVAIMDIDDFQDLTDIHGFDVGDCILQDASKILLNKLRSSDLVSRLKDDEFAILLEDISFENTKLLFEKIENALSSHIVKIGELSMSFHISIGIFHGNTDNDLKYVLKKAKQSLKYSKENEHVQVTINGH